MSSIAARWSAARYSEQPFPHFVIEDALEPATYRSLAAVFPPLERIAGAGRPIANNTLYLRSAAQIVDNPGIDARWRAFFRHHVSQAFWAEIAPRLRTAILAVHPDLERRAGLALTDMTAAMRGGEEAGEVLLDCQFGLNSPVRSVSTVRTPHIDRPNKLFNALLYFRAPEDDTPGGDLELYRCRRRPAYGPDGRSVAPTRIEPVATVPYRANTLVVFVNSPISVHGVSPRAVTGHCRRYVNFLCEYREPLFDVPRSAAWAWQLEQSLHGLRRRMQPRGTR